MPGYDYLVIDAFADAPFTGNPAGVVPDASRLTDEQMRAIAREIHLSETVFVLPATRPNAAVRFRTLTATGQTGISGHGAVAAVTAMMRMGRFTALLDDPGVQLPVETERGILSTRAERIVPDGDEFIVWLALPPPRLKRYPHDPAKTAKLLGLPPDELDASMPAMRTHDDDVILFVGRFPALMDAHPDWAALAAFSRRRGVRAWCVATLETLSRAIDVHSRCFAPAVGVDEEPTSASVHAPLGVYLVVGGHVASVGGKTALTCLQSDSTGRTGLVRTLVRPNPPQGYDVWVGGRCFVTMAGQLNLPA